MRIWIKKYANNFKQYCCCNSTNKVTGFSLAEMAVTAVVVGVLAAVSVPNLLGLMNQNRLKQAMSEIESGLKEAQRQAMRRGRSCTVTITNTNLTAAPAGCLLRERNLSNISSDISISTPPAPIVFSYKGNVDTNDYIIPIQHTQIAEQKCVQVYAGLGNIKTGTYNGTDCITSTSD
jgi:type II secretory pathway pseudopilin PulG